MTGRFTESQVEAAGLAWLEAIGWQVAHGPDIATDTPAAERRDYGEVVLSQRLRDALARLNPDLPAEALEDAYRKMRRPEGADLVQRNRAVHRLLVDGVTVEYRDASGAVRGAQARVLDFHDPDNNDWLAVNQFTVVENRHSRRPDIVLFVNGLPLAVVELKNPADEEATIWTAYQQLQTYQAEIPSLFAYNEVLVVSDGVEARVGALGAGREWFKPWRTIGGETLAVDTMPQLQVVIEGLLEKRRLLDLVRDFIVFEDDGSGRPVKKMAGYHQFHAAQVAVAETLREAELARVGQAAEETGRYEAGGKPGGKRGDRRIGVVWHTQGSGKSLTMAFYAGRIVREPAMENPTIVVLTDRNDLDDQLFGTFSRCQDLLRQPPVQAESRAHLRALLSAEAGGAVFTTPSPQPSPIGRGSKGEGNLYRVAVHGFDYYNTKTGQIESGSADKIALWMLDIDYDGRSLYPRQVFFPMAGENEGWARLAKNLKAEIDEERIEAYRGTVSLPFELGEHKQIAVKIVDDRGIESLKVMEVE